MTELVLATHNAHKVSEFQALFDAAHAPYTVLGYDGPSPAETGSSFAENALIKARAAAAHTGKIAFADDSGLCVDVMGGAPGIFSARWAGQAASDQANRTLLLEQLAEIADPHRRAAFHCEIAVVFPGAEPTEFTVGADWPGHLAMVETGTNGFGYDPIFVPDGVPVSAAELAPEVKNEHSHRARAFAALLDELDRRRRE